jgi:hypothetical protein
MVPRNTDGHDADRQRQISAIPCHSRKLCEGCVEKTHKRDGQEGGGETRGPVAWGGCDYEEMTRLSWQRKTEEDLWQLVEEDRYLWQLVQVIKA